MKKALLVSAMVCAAVMAQGQGMINFANATSAFGTATPDHLIRWSPGMSPALVSNGLVSSNSGGLNLSGLRAQLFYGPTSVTSLYGLTALSDAPATFRSSTSANAGSWIGGARIFPGFDPGSTLNLQVVVWDSSISSNPLSLLGPLWGTSGIFTYTIPAVGSPPTSYLPANMQPFFVGVPEPSTIALVGVGSVALLVVRRTRQPHSVPRPQ